MYRQITLAAGVLAGRVSQTGTASANANKDAFERENPSEIQPPIDVHEFVNMQPATACLRNKSRDT